MSNGVKIPKIALGTWLMSKEQAEQAVRTALEIGYRHIDTAQAYENEDAVGKAVRESRIDRDEIFVTTKVQAEFKTYDSAAKSIDGSLKTMGFDYIDLILIHSPEPWKEFRGPNHYYAENKEVWKALEDAYEAKKVRAIGISNFLIDDMENILEDCRIKPMANQVLAHISNTPFPIIDYCQERDIIVEAYSPIGHGALLKDQSLKAMAEKYSVTVPQLCIRYILQLGCVALPKATSKEHIASNADVDFEIDAADMKTLKDMAPIESYGKDDMFPVFGKGIRK